MKTILYLLVTAISCIGGMQCASAAGVQTPSGDLLLASDGTFYGTSTDGGESGYGTLFQVTADSEVTILIHFTDGSAPSLGAFPKGGLVDDLAGNFWGTTEQGGQAGYGTVFKFTPATATTTAVLTTVHEFTNTDGAYPVGPLLKVGSNFYGTTREGGANGLGTIFRIDASDPSFTHTVIAEFTGTSGLAKGAHPKGGLQLDGPGRLWGTTSAGGLGNLGTVFRTDLATVTTVVEFTGTNGANPGAAPLTSLASDGAGNLWGTTSLGGSGNFGTVFKVSTTTDAYSTVHELDGVTDGSGPAGILTPNGAGGFFGTARGGGSEESGTIFSINITTGILTTVLDFTGTVGSNAGAFPTAGLIPDGLGNFYGTTTKGGADNNGTIIRIDAASGDFHLVAEPYDTPHPPTTSVTAPPTTGTIGATINLIGTANPELGLKSVLVSLNGAPFLPATLVEGADPSDPVSWSIAILPIVGQNTVLIKSVDNGGDVSKVTTLKFNYGPVLPNVGTYNGLVSPTVSSTTPLQHSGFFTLKVLPTKKFTGKLMLSGQKAISLKGVIDDVVNVGTAQFGKLRTATLTIPRGALPTQTLTLGFASGPSFAAVATGSISESNVVIATLSANEALYTSKKNPPSPLLNVPTTLLNPLSDKGIYTGAFLPLSVANQGNKPATDFPQGSGITLVTVGKTGKASFRGKLADGVPFTASALLTEGNVFPLYAKLYGGKGALTGLITFQETPGQSDADGSGLRWYKSPATNHLSYPLGWIDGIQTDFIASKFVPSKLTPTLTPLGNLPTPNAANALITLNHTGLGAAIDTQLSITLKGTSTALDTEISNLKVKFSTKGAVSGTYIDSSSTKLTPFSGVVLQKTQTAYGFFLALPPAATPTLSKQSGSLEITAQ